MNSLAEVKRWLLENGKKVESFNGLELFSEGRRIFLLPEGFRVDDKLYINGKQLKEALK